MLNTKANKIYLNMSEGRNVKVRINALFHRLKISKNIKFQTHITWKRHQNKTETRQVNHEHGYSTYEESVFLDLNLVYNEAKAQYEDKNTEIVAVITHEGKVKSGGYAKYNIAQVLNSNLEGKIITIPLTQCPDPNANVEVTFTCQSLEEGFGETGSVLNASSRDLNLSRIDFHDDKISLQMDRINATIGKLDQLAKNVKKREKNTSERVPELLKQIQQLEGEKDILAASSKRLEEQLAAKEKENTERSKRDQKTINELEKQLQKKDKDFRSREMIELDGEKKLRDELSKRTQEMERYKQLYEETLNELQQSKGPELRQSMGFGKMEVDDVHEIAKFEHEEGERDSKQSNSEMEKLRNENNELQGSLATMSYKLAQLFNSAYEYGGAKLLDFLQTSIGLTEF